MLKKESDNPPYQFVFQNKYATDTLLPTGAEMLFRPPHGRPDVFVEGLSIKDRQIFTRYMLGQAASASLDMAKMPDCQSRRVAVNVSYADLVDPFFMDCVAASLASFPAAELMLEVIESGSPEDIQATAVAMEKFAELGVVLSMDDFGTGSADIALLKMLPFNDVKLDRSLLANVVSSGSRIRWDDAIEQIKKIREDVTITVEGVESKHHHFITHRCDVDILQGYYLAMPVNADLWLTKNK